MPSQSHSSCRPPVGICKKMSHLSLRGRQRPDNKTLSTFPSLICCWITCCLILSRCSATRTLRWLNRQVHKIFFFSFTRKRYSYNSFLFLFLSSDNSSDHASKRQVLAYLESSSSHRHNIISPAWTIPRFLVYYLSSFPVVVLPKV